MAACAMALAILDSLGRMPTTLQPNSGIATVGDAYLTFTAPGIKISVQECIEDCTKRYFV